MPRWIALSQALTSLQRRYRSNAAFSEILTGLLPTVQADRHWVSDTLGVFGLFAQSPGDGINLAAAVLNAPPDRDVLVHKVEFFVDSAFIGNTHSLPFHLFTPLAGYDPVAIAPGGFFAWLQMGAPPGASALVGRAFSTVGLAAAHQTVVLNGVPIVTFGPIAQTPRLQSVPGADGVDAGTSGFINGFWAFQDPPLRILAGGRLCVQDAVGVLAIGEFLNVNFWYSEREPQGGVG